FHPIPSLVTADRCRAEPVATDGVAPPAKLSPWSLLHLAMEFSAARQPTGYISRLQQRTLGWKVGCQIPRDSYEDVLALVAIAPLVKLPHARLEHLVGVKTGILTEQRVRERRNQRFGWVTEDEMAGNKSSRSTDLLLAVKGVEQSSADLLGRDGQVIESLAALARQRRRRYI